MFDRIVWTNNFGACCLLEGGNILPLPDNVAYRWCDSNAWWILWRLDTKNPPELLFTGHSGNYARLVIEKLAVPPPVESRTG